MQLLIKEIHGFFVVRGWLPHRVKHNNSSSFHFYDKWALLRYSEMTVDR